MIKRFDPDKDRTDMAYEIGRAIASSVPVAGGTLNVLFENVFSSPLERRKEAWLEELVCVVEELQKRVDGLTFEALSENEKFITISLQATQIAMRTHQKEKLLALRSAILNAALSDEENEALEVSFIHLIDRLTPWHLKLLTLFHDPAFWMEEKGIKNVECVRGVVEQSFPELNDNQDFCDFLFRDLQTTGLLAEGDYFRADITNWHEQAKYMRRTSDIGEKFLAFISDSSA